jgi:hypothetical protein
MTGFDAHANFIDRLRSTIEDDGAHLLQAKIERLEQLLGGPLLAGETQRYTNELEAAQAERARRYPKEEKP